MNHIIRLNRVYAAPDPADGRRVLVDRLWPRGLTKEAAAVDEWMKDLAPSHGLRAWFGHQPERWEGFRQRYSDELASPKAVVLLEQLAEIARAGTLTLLDGARDEVHNQAVVNRKRSGPHSPGQPAETRLMVASFHARMLRRSKTRAREWDRSNLAFAGPIDHHTTPGAEENTYDHGLPARGIRRGDPRIRHLLSRDRARENEPREHCGERRRRVPD